MKSISRSKISLITLSKFRGPLLRNQFVESLNPCSSYAKIHGRANLAPFGDLAQVKDRMRYLQSWISPFFHLPPLA